MADVRAWRRRKPSSHTREIVQERLPAELVRAMAEMQAEMAQVQARMTRVEQFLELVSAEYRKRADAA